jgi:hypothetical protein
MHRSSIGSALVFTVIAGAAACRDPLSTSGPDVPRAPEAGTVATSASASVVATTDAGAPDGASPVTKDAPIVDLLHTVACTVAVSSKVDNPKDFPEHLVDGKAETAWNGKTSDLHGFIAFRTPRVSRVRKVELTVGFDKKGPRGDLFTQNHRITRVKLSREGKVLREVDLDPNVRGLQTIEVDEEGGDFRLDVLATLPGSEKTWKELTVSEFRVMGTTGGAPENPEHLPAMAIGNLDGVPERKPVGRGSPPPGPFPSFAALCSAYDKALSPVIDAAYPGDRYPGKIEGPHCRRLADKTVQKAAAALAGGPFVGAEVAHVHDAERESARLVLVTDKGYALTQVVLWSRYHNDPGCGHASSAAFEDAIPSANGSHKASIVRVMNTDIYWLGSPDPGGTIERAYACKVDANGAALCEGPLVTGKSTGWPTGWSPMDGKYPEVTVANTQWDFRNTPILGVAGDLRLGP